MVQNGEKEVIGFRVKSLGLRLDGFLRGVDMADYELKQQVVLGSCS